MQKMESMNADLEKAESELQAKTAELDRLHQELDTLRRDNEVCNQYYLPTPAKVGHSVASVCLYVCLHSKRKTAWAINTKLGTHVLYSSCSAFAEPEVKRSVSQGMKTVTAHGF